jgi:hypothetical protein
VARLRHACHFHIDAGLDGAHGGILRVGGEPLRH